MAENNSTAQVKGGVVPYLHIDGAMKAVEFYKKAFGATLAFAMPADDKGRTMHAHVHINGGSLMLSDFYPEHGHAAVKPQGYDVMLPVQDVDQWFKRAVEAGCTSRMEPQDMFWGDRYAQLTDPFGVAWAINGPKRG
ncbi:MAG TPA: glyoxalase/bleomycin resistance/extradiol dioxygenase family protein [Alphaproteobacteria bacterium]|nr:glyoxalase/bleomycin resistance/extradiol dioxygenase family protein [Alphaproteobacteria bacterium]